MPNLTSCLDCGHKVSEKAASCPKCGRVNPAGEPAGSIIAKASLVVCGFLVILGMLNNLAAPGPLERKYQGLSEASTDALKSTDY